MGLREIGRKGSFSRHGPFREGSTGAGWRRGRAAFP
jgi:hypothetical protein